MLYYEKIQQIRRFFTLALYGMLHGIELFKNLNLLLLYRGFPGVKNLPAMQETWFDPLVGKIPWRRKWQPTPVFLPGKPHGQRSLVGYSPWGCQRVGHDLATKQHYNNIGMEDGSSC